MGTVPVTRVVRLPRKGLDRAESRRVGGSRLPGAKIARMPKKARRRPARSIVLRRWLAVGALVLRALLYYRPMKAYMDARSELGHRSHVVHTLQAGKSRLHHPLGSSPSPPRLSRDARPLG